MEFAEVFPCWMEGGVPVSWQHYLHGRAYLARRGARESVRLAGAASIAQAADKDDRKRWWERQTMAAGW